MGAGPRDALLFCGSGSGSTAAIKRLQEVQRLGLARELARALHERCAYACFDFACSGPYVDIDMRSGEIDGYDAVFLSPHKFIGGPGSPGVLLLSEALYGLKGRPPSTSGGGTVLYVNGYNEEDTLYCEDLEEREDAGTPPILQKVRAALAYRVKDYMGESLIKHRESVMVARAMERLLANPRVRMLGNTRADRLPVVSFLLYPPPPRAGDTCGKHLHCRFVTRLLNDLFGVQARGGCACAGPYGHALLGITRDRAKSIRSAIEKEYEGVKPGWTIVSFSYYSTFEELDFVLNAIEFLATYGHRFLLLYRFKWTTGNWAHMNDGHHDRTMRGSSTSDIKSTYSDYLRTAKQIADGLSDAPEQQRVPDYINRELVDFRI
ncbi:hypothetical protein QJS10_CPA10g01353 [Acorus calamus]|uniref:Aminotransferase class V domain-containing protein n=1 Tax=Acorus calamus TaxID=4465 RepID=A0AAV9DY36_ACOCL|nr:hypothetical protein QJS10_CPA10g01353 [Acorus calamus]